MNTLVLGTFKGRFTAKRIALALQCPCQIRGTDVLPEHRNRGFIIRYGNTHTALNNLNIRRVINKLPAIKLASNKQACRKLILSNGLRAPMLYYYDDIMQENITFPIIARPIYHFGGRGFHIIHNKVEAVDAIRQGMYLQAIVQKKEEFRMFIINNRIIESSIKRPTSESCRDNMVWNHESGWNFFYIPNDDIAEHLRSEARMAISACGLDFGAVDVCVDKEDKAWIFEINTAPGLIDRKAEKFALRLKQEFIGE